MTIFGKRLSEYVSFAKLFLILIPLVAIIRFALSPGSEPSPIGKWFSVTAALWIALVYYAIKVHTSGFGSYKQLLPICVLAGLSAQAIIVPAIILAIFTGNDNIYSIPENFFGRDGKTWLHVAGHLFIGGTTIGPLLSWLIGCVIMFVTKKVTAKGEGSNAAARA
jgi:hypothetical protein